MGYIRPIMALYIEGWMSEDKDIANCHCDKLYFRLAESALFLAVDL